jgi:DNA-binding protein HU-beta
MACAGAYACNQLNNPLVLPGNPAVYLEVAVNRTELIEAISADTGLTRQLSEAALDAVVYEITAGVRSGSPVRITGFGTFKLRERQARRGRNPQTGAPVRIKASKGIGFTPGVTLKSDLNSRSAPARPRPAAAPAAAKAVAKKAPATKTVAKKTAAKKTVAKKTVAKAAAKKAVVKTVAKKGAAKKATTKATVARKAPAKRASR